MNKFFKTATLSLSAALLLAPAAHARELSIRESADKLIATIERHGEFYSEQCPQDKLRANGNITSGGNYTAFFAPSHNAVIMCEDQINPGSPDYFSALKHEAVHMAQNCKVPFASGKHMPVLGTRWVNQNATDATKQFVVDHYDTHNGANYWIESEAYTLQNYSFDFITNLVNKHCG